MSDLKDTPSIPHNRLYGIWIYILALLLIGLLDTSSRYLSTRSDIPLTQIVWLRFVVHMLVISLLFGLWNIPTYLKTNKPGLQWLRSLFMVATTIMNFTALKYLQLDQAIVFFFLSPFIIALLAGPMLGEYIGWRRMLAIIVGFLGVVIMARPGFGGIHWAAVFSLFAVTFYALYILMTRYLAPYDSTMTTLYYSPLAGVILMAPFGLAHWVTPASWDVWLAVLGMGVFGGLGHYFVIIAHHHAPAPILAPFIYTAFITQTILGYVVFGELPTLTTVAGGLIIIGSGLYLLWRERKPSY